MCPTCTPPAIYDRLSGNLVQAWNKSTDFSNPWDFNASNAATTAQLNNLSTIDENWYRTDLAGDNQFNYHMYNITVDTPVGDIEEMTAYWAGKGEGFTSRDDLITTVWVWNWSSNSWEVMQDRDDVVGTSGFVYRITSGFGDYINSSTKAVFIKAMAEHEEDPFCCPYVFGWDGGSYKFIDAAITHSFLERYEEATFDAAAFLEAEGGCYDLMLYGPFSDEWHINSLGLKAVDHPSGTRVVAGFDGEPVVVSQPQAVTAVDSYGRDVTSLLERQDDRYWESDLSDRDFNDVDQLHDWIEFTLPEAPGEGIARLLVDIRVTLLSDLKLWFYTQYLLGSPNAGYLVERSEHDGEFMQCLDYTAWLTAAPRVQYWDGVGWVDVEDAPAMPSAGARFGSPMVFPLDLSKMEGDRVRLVVPAGEHEIDYVAVDYTAEEPVAVSELELVEATLHLVSRDVNVAATRDVLDEVLTDDDLYACFEQGDYINYRFRALDEPDEGVERTFITAVGGYYYCVGPEVAEDRMSDLPLLEELICEPNRFCSWALPRYASPEEYPYSGYWSQREVLLPPPFEVDWDSLDADYVGITVAECTDFNESPHGPLKAGDWWMWNVSYDNNIFESMGEDWYDFAHRNWAFQIETVNTSGQSAVVYYNQSQREGSSGHSVSNCTVIDSSNDGNGSATGRGARRSVLTGTSVMGIGDQAENYMLDNRRWCSPWDATTYYKGQFLVWVLTAINEEILANNWYTQGGDLTNHAAEDYGYPYALNSSLNTHEYYFVAPDNAAATDQNVERDWNTRVVSYVDSYNLSKSSNQMFNSLAYDHDGNASNAVYDVWLTDQYQTSDSYQGSLTPESGSRIHWYAPEVKNDVRKLDAYQYVGAEESVIQAYEVGTYNASGLVVSWGTTTNWSVNITNTDSSNGKYINVLGMILDTDACPGGNASECYINGQTVYPNVSIPDSTTVWPFFNAIKHTWFNASETKQLTWSTGYDTSSGTEWAVWCQGQYAHK